jgi:ribosomal protein S27E
MTTANESKWTARCPNCNARILRPANGNDGMILKSRWIWAKPDGTADLACYQCGTVLGLRRGPTPLLFRRVPDTRARQT